MVDPIILPNIDRSGEVNNKKYYDVRESLGKASPGRGKQHYRNMTIDVPRVLNKDQSGTSLISLQPSSFRGVPNDHLGTYHQQPRMFFGQNKNSEERVFTKMLDNMQRDPEVSLRTLLGNDN